MVPSTGPAGVAFELVSPHPLAESLPGVYLDAWNTEFQQTNREAFGRRFLEAFDAALAPIIATLDNLDAYLDPGTTPDDFLTWLGEWVAAAADASWSEDRRRAFVGQAAELYRRRGTAAGLRDHVQIHAGGTVEVMENGATSWSATADGKLPGTPEPVVVVRVMVDDPSTIDPERLDALVRGAKPAHVVHRVEIIEPGKRPSRGRSKAGTQPTSAKQGPAADETASDDSATPGAPGVAAEPEATGDSD